MQDGIDAQCQEAVREEVSKLLDLFKVQLEKLPLELVPQIPLLRSRTRITDDLAFDFGEAGGLAFVLQHGSHDFPSLHFMTMLFRAVGTRITRILEKA